MVLFAPIFGAPLQIWSILWNCSCTFNGNYGRSKGIMLTILENDCEHNLLLFLLANFLRNSKMSISWTKSQYQKIWRLSFTNSAKLLKLPNMNSFCKGESLFYLKNWQNYSITKKLRSMFERKMLKCKDKHCLST